MKKRKYSFFFFFNFLLIVPKQTHYYLIIGKVLTPRAKSETQIPLESHHMVTTLPIAMTPDMLHVHMTLHYRAPNSPPHLQTAPKSFQFFPAVSNLPPWGAQLIPRVHRPAMLCLCPPAIPHHKQFWTC